MKIHATRGHLYTQATRGLVLRVESIWLTERRLNPYSIYLLIGLKMLTRTINLKGRFCFAEARKILLYFRGSSLVSCVITFLCVCGSVSITLLMGYEVSNLKNICCLNLISTHLLIGLNSRNTNRNPELPGQGSG